MKPQTTSSWMNRFSAQNPLQELTPEQAAKARQIRAAREKAKISTSKPGPRTPEGKATSSQNARKHGFAGANMVVDDEDRPAYHAHLDAYHDGLQPANQIEADAVRLAANSMWRADRLTSIETGLLELEMAHHSPHIDAKMQNLTLYHYMAIAFMEQTDSSNSLELCRRYLANAQRDFQRAIDTFYKLKENRIAPPPETAPEPAPEPKDGKIHLIVPKNPRPPNESAPRPRKRLRTTKPDVNLPLLHDLKRATKRRRECR
jgi:hypothetical protein